MPETGIDSRHAMQRVQDFIEEWDSFGLDPEPVEPDQAEDFHDRLSEPPQLHYATAAEFVDLFLVEVLWVRP